MLEFSHWEMIEDDPFYIPTTVEVYFMYYIRKSKMKVY